MKLIDYDNDLYSNLPLLTRVLFFIYIATKATTPAKSICQDIKLGCNVQVELILVTYLGYCSPKSRFCV